MTWPEAFFYATLVACPFVSLVLITAFIVTKRVEIKKEK